MIANLRLEKKITIEAPIYGLEKTKLLTGAIAVIYPAIEEPFGRTIFEAFAAGTLCILPEKSGGAEYVEEFAPNLIYHDTSEASLNDLCPSNLRKITADKNLPKLGSKAPGLASHYRTSGKNL